VLSAALGRSLRLVYARAHFCDKLTVSALYLASLDWEIHEYAKELQIAFEVKRRIEVSSLENSAQSPQGILLVS
jgi:hypothetical protein